MNLNEKIDHLERMLLTGANSVTVDGITASLNIDSMRQQLRELKRQKARSSEFKRVTFTRGYDGY